MFLVSDSIMTLTKKMYTEMRSMAVYYERNDNQLQELQRQLSVIHAGAISMRKTAVACFPWQSMDEVLGFAERRDMNPLRLRLTAVPFKTIKNFATDVPLALFSKNLIAKELTWPSPQ